MELSNSENKYEPPDMKFFVFHMTKCLQANLACILWFVVYQEMLVNIRPFTTPEVASKHVSTPDHSLVIVYDIAWS